MHATKWRGRARGRARAWLEKWASSRSRVRRACWNARSIRRLTPNCWINWRPRLRVAERATIARPYAKAAFEYARGANALAAWSEGLKVAAEIVADPRVAPLTKSPAWSASALVSLITDFPEPKLDAGMQNFVPLLSPNHPPLPSPHTPSHSSTLPPPLE